MGQNNRTRRAAKQRKRQRTGTPRATNGCGWQNPPSVVDLAIRSLEHAQHQRRLGVPPPDCVRGLSALPQAAIGKAVELIAADLLHLLFAGGWTPVDLVELARRRTDAAGTRYILDTLASVTAEYPSPLVDPRWQAQLDRFEARVWWDRRHPHLTQWAGREDHSTEEALTVVLDVHGLFGELPKIEQVLPPPGTPTRPRSPRGTDEAVEKVMAKVRALLAKAESTSYDDEAEALSAKAQQLMTRHALDRALIEHGHGARQQATLCRIWLDNPYVNAKAMLVDAVARANRCRTVLATEWGYITLLGDAVDLGGVELLATSLLVQATRAMVSTGSQFSRGGVSRTRSYRQSFLLAYADRIGERLRAADQASQSTIDDDRLLPVLSARSRAVDDLVEEYFPHLVSKRVTISNGAGWGAGRAAADLATINLREALDDNEEQRRTG